MAAVTQLAECLMRAGSANDALRRYGPVAELLGSSAPAWPELDARLDVWLDTVREMDVKVWGLPQARCKLVLRGHLRSRGISTVCTAGSPGPPRHR